MRLRQTDWRAAHRGGERSQRRALLLPPERGGYGLDAQWSDDFHHAVHTLLDR